MAIGHFTVVCSVLMFTKGRGRLIDPPPQDFMTYRPTKLIKCLHPLSDSESLLFSDVGWVAVLFHSASVRVKTSFTHVQTAELRWGSLTDFVDSNRLLVKLLQAIFRSVCDKVFRNVSNKD